MSAAEDKQVRRSADRKNGARKDYTTKVCPKCSKVANNPEEITELFGWRINGTMPQSWCKTCKTENASESRRRRREAQKAKEESEASSNEEE